MRYLQEDESDRCQNIDWYFSVIFVQDLDEAHSFLFDFAVMLFNVDALKPCIDLVAALFTEHLKFIKSYEYCIRNTWKSAVFQIEKILNKIKEKLLPLLGCSYE